MRPLSPLLSSLASAFKPHIRLSAQNASRAPTTTSILSLTHQSPARAQPTRQFSATPFLGKKLKNEQADKPDRRVTLIRYFLYHPRNPRPLKFSRTRYLRHWTIHRAWHLYQARRRRAHELDMQRQYHAMSAACEELRTGAYDGGKLFRVAMNKRGVYTQLAPIEYGRLQTEWPSLDGWDHGWTRPRK